MEKIDFLNLIEGHYGLQLTKPQLQYFFAENKYVAMTCPRRGGKSFIAYMDSLYPCTTPNTKVAIVLPYEHGVKIAKDEIINMANALNEYMHILSSLSNCIQFSNGSKIYLFNAKNFEAGVCGCRLNQVTIEEPDQMVNMESIKHIAEACMCPNENAQFKIIGTHGISRHNLAAYMLSPYFKSITATLNNTHVRYTREQLHALESALPQEVYSLEILNHMTPSILNSTLSNNE